MIKINAIQEYYILKIILFLFFILGIYLSFIGGYGSDEDTLPLIGAYESMLGGKNLMASRFTPYPVAELGIGFLSYNFGSFVTNIFTFSFLFFGLFFFYYAFSEDIDQQKLCFFLILCLSNPVLFFDNLEPIDYSWAFFPLAIGAFFLKKRVFEIAIIFFGISIGTRIYFLLFVAAIIFFYNFKSKQSFQKKIILFFSSFFVGGLFYLPIWFENGLNLAWLTAATPNNQGVFGLSARFIYKIIMSYSLITFCSIIIILFYKNYFKNIFTWRAGTMIILFNLILFFFIPAELSYLQPMLIASYFIISKNFKKNMIMLVILIQLFSWLYEIKFLKIFYSSNNKCDNIEAISAELDLKLIKGRFFQFIGTRDKIKCWLKDMNSTRSIKILNGDPLK